MINAFSMNLGVKSFFLFFFFCEYNRDSWSMLMDQVRKQFFRVFELLLSFFSFIGNSDSFSCFFIYSGQK